MISPREPPSLIVPAKAGAREVSFDGLTDPAALAVVRRGVRGCHRGRSKAARWSHVSDVFGYGSTLSIELCRLCGLDPHEMVGSAESEAAAC